MNGNDTILQFGLETVYGELVPMTEQVEFASEGLKWVPDKKEEGLITGGKSSGKVRTMSIKSEGPISTIAKPDECGYWLYAGLGVEGVPSLVTDSTGAYEHTFTTIGQSGMLPSFSWTVANDSIVKAYTGQKVNTISFNASSGDQLKVEMSFVGKDEVAGTKAAGLTKSVLKSFRFSDAVVKCGTDTLESTSVKFELNNNLDSSLQTSTSGLHFKEPEVGARDVKVDIEVLYSTITEAIRTNYFRTDNTVSVEINFVSEEEVEEGYPYSLKFVIPHAQIKETQRPNISGKDTLKQSISLIGVEEGLDELVTATLINGRATKYNI